MIRIGLGIRQKEKLIKEYLGKNDIRDVFVLYSEKYHQKLNIGREYEEIEYNEWEMYRTFYPMIEKVRPDSLIIVNEALRTTNYQDLKVNCATVWINQTPHRIIFNTLPFIDNKEDFRILQKLDQGMKQVEKFDYVQLQLQDIRIKPYKIKLEVIEMIKTTYKQKVSYDKLRDKLALEIEENANKDPNNLPRRLQLKAGDYKKSSIKEDLFYIARNGRFKLDNVETYQNFDKNKNHIIIDLPTSRMNLVDYIIDTKTNKLEYISTDLSIDTYMVNEFSKWKGRLDAFYAKANLY
ncbi:hypothetical protein KQI68_06415 [Peptoniphilus sp. MSJ-1]|uniref:Uncharacterized protein n=1 Tax=Peptoniphilus ovalis TaxID=2841503 RepID=A0ABS6FH23_9FIRM|nr:hypothetical protein [Peptoniphilus ovalis]MBU5669470.1 hypothetical protein [Peptoniphilus ovalis]